MNARVVRLAANAVCVAGIAGMIASSVAGSTGWALTFGLATATAVLCSIVATAVSPSEPVTGGGEAGTGRIEGLVQRLVESGADEADVRALVREALRLGRAEATAAPTSTTQPGRRSSSGSDLPI